MFVLGGIMSETRVCTIQYIHESCSCYHPIHTRVPLMIPPNTDTSPAHVITQYIHESHSCYHPIHTRVTLNTTQYIHESRSIPPIQTQRCLSPAHDTIQYIHESCSCYHPIHTRVPLMIAPNTYTSPAQYHPSNTKLR